MRIAFVGKGGSGKSTIVGTMSRMLAAAGEPTLVLDSDVMPGLAGAMGIDFTDAEIPIEAVVEKPEGEEGPRFHLRDGLTASGIVDQYAIRGPDDVRLLQLGKIRTQGAWTIMHSLFAFNVVKEELPENEWHLIGDLPGGTRQPFFGWGSFAPLMLVVVEPTVKSFITARRMIRGVAEADNGPRLVAVANKVDDHDDVDLIKRETGLEIFGVVPLDRAVGEADRDGTALIDLDPGGPAVAGIRSLLERVRRETS